MLVAMISCLVPLCTYKTIFKLPSVPTKKNFFWGGLLFNLEKKKNFSETPDLYPSVRLIVDPGSTIRPPPSNERNGEMRERSPHTDGPYSALRYYPTVF